MRYLRFVFVFISTILLLTVHAVYGLAAAVGALSGFSVRYLPFLAVAIGLVLLWGALILYGAFVGRFKVKVRRIKLSFASVPKSFEGYRIVQISDLHLDGWQGYSAQLQQIVDKINALEPDLIVFTGDLISITDAEVKPFAGLLSALRARDGVVAILGNHDYMPYVRNWDSETRKSHVDTLIQLIRDELHWKLLLNENVVISRGDGKIAILGCENQSMGVHSVVRRGNLRKAMEGTDGLFRILLTHDPTHWRGEVTKDSDIPLTLSGHTHGGQFAFFGHFRVSGLLYREHASLYTDGEQLLYVNTGLGGTVPMRVGLPCEVTEITLSGGQA